LLGKLIGGGLLIIIVAGSFIFSVMIAALLITSLFPDATYAAMRLMGIGKQALGPNTDELIVGAIMATITLAGLLFMYKRNRHSGEHPIVVMLMAVAPFFVIILVAMGAFVWGGMLLVGVPRWLPNQFGDWRELIDDNYREIIKISVGVSVAAIPLLHYLRLCLWNGVGSKPTFLSAAWVMFWLTGALGLILILLVLLAAALG
jgi:hypothetical protein